MHLPGVPKKVFVYVLIYLLVNEHFFWDTLYIYSINIQLLIKSNLNSNEFELGSHKNKKSTTDHYTN